MAQDSQLERTGFPELLNAQEASEILAVTKRQVYRMLEDRELPVVRIGRGSVRVKASDLAAYIESRTDHA